MSIVEPDRSLTRKFLTVRCPCGRELRAPVAMGGQAINCWECHQMVPVPVPRSPERAYDLDFFESFAAESGWRLGMPRARQAEPSD